MPIYAYRCEACGHAKDVIQKFSDAPLTVCPECQADAFRKQLTAPAFQLKGSGWYVTDFRDQGNKKAAAKSGEGADSGSGGAASEAAPAAPADGKPAGASAPAANATGSSTGGSTAASTPPAAASGSSS